MCQLAIIYMIYCYMRSQLFVIKQEPCSNIHGDISVLTLFLVEHIYATHTINGSLLQSKFLSLVLSYNCLKLLCFVLWTYNGT